MKQVIQTINSEYFLRTACNFCDKVIPQKAKMFQSIENPSFKIHIKCFTKQRHTL